MELEDIQGLLIRGHAEMPYASYIMLKIEAVSNAKSWLQNMLPRITPGNAKPELVRYQIAFTCQGLEILGNQQIDGFLVEFTQGMHTEFRSRILGDIEDSDPRKWTWGGPDTIPIHIVLMIFARNAQVYDEAVGEFQNCHPFGLRKIAELKAPPNPHGKEHFGFKDGITQPILPGLSKSGRPENTVAPGEFILGYKNGYDQIPESPVVRDHDDPLDLLPASDKKDFRDFGKNGSYMVFRQIDQNVEHFWKQADIAAEQMGQTSDACIYAAAKMVGRWPDGTPLSKAPDENMKTSPTYFLYREEGDTEGFKCPLGAHIRRTNPRDVLPDNNAASSVRISNLHRILRRGRTYGPPLVDDMDPLKLKDTPDDGNQRGLYFIGFNANIARQFEFVQHMWCNNPKFAGQYNDPDPVLGVYEKSKKGHDFTIQAEPVRKKVQGLTPSTHVVGGAYFFMPGLRALKFLTNT